MKLLWYACVCAILTASTAAAQVTITQNPDDGVAVRTGYAVITPLQGGGQGLSASETLIEDAGGNLFQASVLPSPLVTLTSVFTRTDPESEVDTGISIVNPNENTATLVLTLRTQTGVTVGVRTITVGGRRQISRFVTELFLGFRELSAPFTGLLFISSDLPVGVLGLSFTGPSFTALPVAIQLSPDSLIVVNPTNPARATLTGRPINPIAPLPTRIVAPFVPIVPVMPVTPSTLPVAAIIATGLISPSTAIVQGGSFVTTSVANVVGGPGAQLLSQIATGGGWVTRIVIANTSSVAQLIRIDFFNSAGGPLVLPFGAVLTNILVPAGGAVIVSTG
jgi:hypothetical protein